MNAEHTKYIKNKIAQKLINPNINITCRAADEFIFSNRQMMFEQYKALIDSAHKIEERRGGSNNIFLGINTILASFLVRPAQLSDIAMSDLPILILLILIGITISWEWLKVNASYKKINFINYSLIEALEKSLPTCVFSLRGEIEQEKSKPTSRANIILIKENLLPKVFILLYLIYLATTCYLSFR